MRVKGKIQRFFRKNFTIRKSNTGKIQLGDILLSAAAVALVLVMLISMVNIFVGLRTEEVIAPTESSRKTLYRDVYKLTGTTGKTFSLLVQKIEGA